MLRKIMAFALVFVMVLTSSVTLLAYAPENEEILDISHESFQDYFNFETYSDDLLTEESVFNRLSLFVGGSSMSRMDSGDDYVLKSDFGGMHVDIDDPGVLVLLFREDSESLENAVNSLDGQMIDFSRDGVFRVEVRASEHSEEDLESIRGLLIDNMLELGIRTLGVLVDLGRVQVGLIEETRMEEFVVKNNIIKFLVENSRFNEDELHSKIEFLSLTEDDIPQLFTRTDERDIIMDAHVDIDALSGNIGAGSMVNNGRGYATVGLRSINALGFITTGHEFRQGDVIFQGRFTQGLRVGRVERVTFNGRDDSAFVRLEPGVPFAGPNNDIISSARVVHNQVLSAQGGISGTMTMRVLRPSHSYTGHGFTWHDIIVTDRAMRHGDSGGALFTLNGSQRTIRGLVHGMIESRNETWFIPSFNLNTR